MPELQEQDVKFEAAMSNSTRSGLWPALLIAVIATAIVTIFIQPILNFVSKSCISFLTVFYSGFVNRLYYQAAVSPGNVSIFETLLFVIVVPISVMSGFTGMRFGRLAAKRSKNANQQGRKIPRFLRGERAQSNVLIINFAMAVVAALILIVGAYVPMQAGATFQQRLAVLAPVLSDSEQKALVSQWAMMKGRADYDRINLEFDEIADKNHVKLPAPLI